LCSANNNQFGARRQWEYKGRSVWTRNLKRTNELSKLEQQIELENNKEDEIIDSEMQLVEKEGRGVSSTLLGASFRIGQKSPTKLGRGEWARSLQNTQEAP